MKPSASPSTITMGVKKDKLAETGFPVTPFQMKIESASAQLPDRKKSVQACIHQKQFVQGPQAAWPCAVKPPQVDSEAQHQQDERISPVAALLRHRQLRARSSSHAMATGSAAVKCKPLPPKRVQRKAKPSRRA